jgi:hypothetical protein
MRLITVGKTLIEFSAKVVSISVMRLDTITVILDVSLIRGGVMQKRKTLFMSLALIKILFVAILSQRSKSNEMD